MGVRGLFTYIEKQCPEALEDVDLRRLGDQYRRRYNTRPVLLLDCNNYIRDIYGNLEFALGGQWNQHLENLKAFLGAFHKAGFDLVTIFDSVIEKKKLKTWVQRRKQERKLVSKIFSDIKTYGQHPSHKLFHIPPSLSTFTRLVMKSLGASVHNSSIELDRECYLYCKKHACYGVVSRDTDLMIYDVPGVFLLTYRSGRIQRVQQFRKDILCHHLGIHRFLLPLFACLVGCDTVQQPMLSKFHDMVTRGRRDPLIPCVAGFIASLQLRDLSRETVEWVAGQVGGSLGNGFLYECIQEYTCDPQELESVPPRSLGVPRSGVDEAGGGSSSTLSICNIDPSVVKQIESCHHNLLITDFVMQCISIQQYYSNMTFEDDTDDSVPSSALVYRPVRQLMYGILLHSPQLKGQDAASGSARTEGQQAHFGAVEEICPYAGNPMNDPDIVPGLASDLTPQPRIEDLWKDSGDAERLRQRVFFSCLSSTPLLEKGFLDAVPRQHVLLCCILHYLLVKAPAATLRSCDVDAFISQAICLQGFSPQSLEKMKVTAVDPRAVHLASIFIRGVKTGCDLNSTCCLPFKMDALLPWHSFDGKLFHLKYLAAQSRQSPDQLCDHRARAVESFHEMRRWIVMGTRLEL